MINLIFLYLSLGNIEKNLRNDIFKNYSNQIRPVLNYSDPVTMNIGLNIKGLEKFNQVSETIDYNLWITMRWKDEFLNWNKDSYNIEYIDINANDIWLPDLELYNAAKLPEVYNVKDQLRLYSDGTVLYQRPVTYSLLCPLDLKKFPYDKQTCKLEFGSWKLNSDKLDILPFNINDEYKPLLVDPKFSHNEWKIVRSSFKHTYNEYMCCPNEYWPVTTFNIEMERNSNKFTIILLMTVLLVFSAFIVSFIKFKTYRRTYILVFIPLSIIWLVQSISNKLPVIGYFSTMEYILFFSFVLCEIFTGISGIFFSLYGEFYDHLKKIYKIKKYSFNKNACNFIKTINYESNMLNHFEQQLKYRIYKDIKFKDKTIKLLLFLVYLILLIYFLNN